MSRTFAILALILAAAGSAAAQGWEDTFDAPALNARWAWRVPAVGPTMSLAERPGWLRIRIPQQQNGFNHWNQPAGTDAAPQLRAPVPAGDWELEARIQVQEYAPGSNFHLGLMAGLNDAQLVVWGAFFGPGLPGGQLTPEVWMEPTGQSGFAKVRADAKDVTLRLTKVGRACLSALRHGEGDWVDGGTYQLADAPRFFGLIGKTFFDGPGVSFDVDYVRMIPREPRMDPPVDAEVKVDATAKPVPLNPLRAGHFIEHVGRCVYGGLWAEMLGNRKFTGAASYQGVVEGWWSVGGGPDVTFAPDNRIFYAPLQSQRIVHNAAGEPCGISQSGLSLRQGVGLTGRVLLRREGEIGPVTLSLRAGQRLLAEQQIADVAADWQPYPFTFVGPDARVTDAEFSITFAGAGTLWVGAASLMPEDNVDGWRRDVVDLAKAIRPAVLRWPGGNMASAYRWEDGVGPRDRRPVRWERAWGAWEPNDVGTDEFLRLCELLGARPYIVLNTGTADAREAAGWVAYCNTAGTPEARLRANNGHPDPFAVRFWGIGHEAFNNKQIGYLPAPAYALQALEFARAIRAADPEVKLVAVGGDSNTLSQWNRQALSALGADVDYVSVHCYQPTDPAAGALSAYAAALNGPAEMERVIERTAAQLGALAPPGKAVAIALDEWNVWPKDAGTQNGIEVNHTLTNGLYAFSMLNALARQDERLGFANMALLVNALGAIRTTPVDATATPVYLAFRLHAEHSGTARLPVTVQCPQAPLPGATLPTLDALATVSEDGSRLYLALLNRHPMRPVRVALDVAGFVPAAGEWAVMVGEEIGSVNTPEAPEAVRIETRPLKPEELKAFVIPAHTAAVVTLTRAAK